MEENEIVWEPTNQELTTCFQEVILAIRLNEASSQDFHACLKCLQQSRNPVHYDNNQFIWNNAKQQVVGYPENPDTFLSDDIEEALEVLNKYVEYDRQQRRADRYHWQEQEGCYCF